MVLASNQAAMGNYDAPRFHHHPAPNSAIIVNDATNLTIVPKMSSATTRKTWLAIEAAAPYLMAPISLGDVAAHARTVD